jgi:MFS family permease
MTAEARRNLRTFYWIIATQTVSLIGSRLTSLAMGFVIFAETGEATPLALVGFFSILPTLFGAAISGVLADRWDRRKVMIIADAGAAVGTVLLLVLVATGAFEVWHLYVVALLQSFFGVFQGPAFQASVTMLIPDNQRDRANTLMQLTGPAAGIIAPIIAGLTYTAVGIVGTIIIDLLSFVVAVVTVFLVRIPKPIETAEGRAASQGGLIKNAFSGFAYLWSRKPLFGLVGLFGLVNACIGGAMSMGMAYLLSRTGSEASAGLVLTLGSAGMFAGGIIYGVWGGTRQRIHTIMPSLIFAGLMLAVFGMAQGTVVLAVTHFLTLFTLPWVNSPAMSILQAKVAPDMQGRVFAAVQMVAMGLMPISYLIYAPLADNVLEPLVGTPGWAAFAPLLGDEKGAGMGLIFFIAGLVMAGICAVAYTLPSFRHMERNLPDYVAAPPSEAETPAPNLPLEGQPA